MDKKSTTASKVMFWAGWIVSALAILGLAFSGAMKFTQGKEVVEGFKHLGWPLELAFALGILELTCAALYAIPPTAVLGAVLLTGYLGGAIATHVRLQEDFSPPVILGVLVWGGLWLRDSRVRSLMPRRGSARTSPPLS